MTPTREQLASIEWAAEWRYDYDWTYACCPVCEGLKPHDDPNKNGPVGHGHTDDCWLAACLAAPPPQVIINCKVFPDESGLEPFRAPEPQAMPPIEKGDWVELEQWPNSVWVVLSVDSDHPRVTERAGYALPDQERDRNPQGQRHRLDTGAETMSDGYETVTTTHAICQHCGGRLGAVDHLAPGRSWGPWYCDTCGGASRGVTGGAVERVESERKVPTLALLRLDTTTGPFWFIVEGMRFTHLDPIISEHESARFFYEEHSCPTNWLAPIMVAHQGDTDPHGAITFVRAIDKPDDFPDDPNDEDRLLAELFPEVRR